MINSNVVMRNGHAVLIYGYLFQSKANPGPAHRTPATLFVKKKLGFVFVNFDNKQII